MDGPEWIVEDCGYVTPCWCWQRARNGYGYGAQRVAGVLRGAHVVAWETVHGPVPAGLQLDHLCRVRECVNPDHLEPVTPRENQRRGLRGVLYTVCAHGHPMTAENIIVRRDGSRVGHRECRTCKRANERRRRRHQREAA